MRKNLLRESILKRKRKSPEMGFYFRYYDIRYYVQ